MKHTQEEQRRMGAIAADMAHETKQRLDAEGLCLACTLRHVAATSLAWSMHEVIMEDADTLEEEQSVINTVVNQVVAQALMQLEDALDVEKTVC